MASNGVEVANAYIALTVRATGIKKSSEEIVNGFAPAGEKAGKSMGSKLTAAMGKTAKIGMAAVGATLAAGLGTALAKGFQRLTAIDNAQAKLRGLGHDADSVTTIMENALASVKGTAFGLGDAATVAAQAVAAGIKPGQQLEGVLSSVANSAAAAGTDLGDMGSIYAKVASLGKAQNDVLQQVADRGIPIYQALGDQLGVTADDVFKMASAGKIGFADFEKAMTAASGTVAAEMGTTWSGSFDNFMAALGRVGEGLLSGLFPQLKGGLQDVTKWLAPFEDGAKQVGAAVGDFVNRAGPVLIDTLKQIFEAGSNVVRWVRDNLTWLGPLVATLGTLAATIGAVVLAQKAWQGLQIAGAAVQVAYAAATYGMTGATYAFASGTTAATIAQKAFNLATKMSPLGWLLTAITAVVGGLTWFFTQTELGKAIWQEFTNFLGEAWTNITGFFTAAWENVIQPVFTKIGEIATWLWENVLSPVFSFISDAVGLLAGYFKFHFEAMVNVIRIIAAVINWLWTNAFQPALTAIGAAAAWLYQNAIKPAFDGIGAVFNWIWTVIIRPIADAIGRAIRVLGDVFTWLNLNIIQPVWRGIQSAISTAWNWINKNVFSPMKTGIDAVGKAFDAVGKFIGEVWTRIQNAAKEPVKFLINTVWNNGIRSFAVDVLKALGLNDLAKGLPRVRLPFADGGVLPGYTPGRDVHEFYSPTGGRLALSGGEAIMRPEFTRAVGGKAGVDRLNRMARKGQAFKNGGVWDQIGNFAGDAWDNITGAANTAWDFITDPVGAVRKHMAGFINGLGGNGVFSDIIAGVPKMLLRGFEQLFGNVVPASRGTAGMGWRAMQDIILANIPGARISSAYRSPAGNAAVGGAKGSYHMQGRAIDIVPPSMAMFNKVKALFPNATELIYTPAGATQLRNGNPFNAWSPKVKGQHYNHIHLAMANGGIIPKLYDQGGWLPHGGAAINRSGRPEAVLTPDESQALKRGLFTGDRLRLVVDSREFNAYVDDRADGRLVAAVPSRGAVRSRLP